MAVASNRAASPRASAEGDLTDKPPLVQSARADQMKISLGGLPVEGGDDDVTRVL
ncbi:MAG: hypothetical protein WCI21_06600 [Alphaproteobacteria bacterium]